MKKTLFLAVCLLALLAFGACQPAHEHTIARHPRLEADCITPGYHAYEECTECDYTTYEEIAPQGHNLLFYEETPATCDAIGRGEHWECDDCGALFLDEQASVEVTEEDIRIATEAHKDENGDLCCDGCYTIVLNAEDLQTLLDNTFRLTDATLREFSWMSATTTTYSLEGDVIRITRDEEQDGYIYAAPGDPAFNVGFLFEERFDFTITSEIELTEHSVGTFIGRPVLRFFNSDNGGVGLLVTPGAPVLDGILIYDGNGNIIYEFVINPQTP